MIKLEKAATKIMAAIGTAVMLFLLFYSWKYTKRLVEPEYYLDEKDSIPVQMVLSAVLLVLCGVFAKLIRKIPKKILHFTAIAIALAAAGFGILLARSAGATAQADQYYIQRAAQALVDGDMTWVLDQNYYRVYSFQLGFAQICAVLFRIMGSTELAVLQYAQAVCAGLTLYAGFRIVRELSDDRAAELFYLIAGMLFFPMYCYALFIYGESIGTCSAVYAIWCYLVLHRPEADVDSVTLNRTVSEGIASNAGASQEPGAFRGRLYRNAGLWVAIGILMTIAYIARNVLLVVWIAMLITEILLWLREKKWQGIAALCCVLLLMITGKNILCNLAEDRIGQEYGSGAPYLLWVAMGMQDNPEEQKGPGTYNDYNLDIYMITGFDNEKSAELAKEEIGRRLTEWKEDPAGAAQFLKEKIMIQWIEPTYGGFNQTRHFYRPQEWVENLYTGKENEVILKFLNYFQGVVYLMILGYYLRILFAKSQAESTLIGKSRAERLLPGIIFLGGFFITVLWEAKSRYVYPYIVMILPCAACSLAYYGTLMADWAKRMVGMVIVRSKK